MCGEPATFDLALVDFENIPGMDFVFSEINSQIVTITLLIEMKGETEDDSIWSDSAISFRCRFAVHRRYVSLLNQLLFCGIIM